MDRNLTELPPAPVAAPPRVTGVVRWFCPDRGFGFLATEDGGEDVFVTYAALPGDGFRCLHEGQRVSFVRTRDPHGPMAADVRILG